MLCALERRPWPLRSGRDSFPCEFPIVEQENRGNEAVGREADGGELVVGGPVYGQEPCHGLFRQG